MITGIFFFSLLGHLDAVSFAFHCVCTLWDWDGCYEALLVCEECASLPVERVWSGVWDMDLTLLGGISSMFRDLAGVLWAHQTDKLRTGSR